MLIDASCWDASEMESGFMSWCERHVPTWRKQGFDETWIRQRIETALIARGLHRKLKERGLMMLEIRDELRKTYADDSELSETEKLTFEKFCRWSGLTVPSPESVFFEQPDHVRVVRDLSTVEELEQMLAMSRYALHLFDAPEHLPKDQIAPLMEAHGKQLRATFIAKHGYRPEDSTTPYVPVTIEGPQDHDAYYAREYP
jgi:hypothetical protein